VAGTRGHAAVEEALRQFGLAEAHVRAIRSGRVNQHWHVATPGRELVLRRYTPTRSLAAIAWEHELLALAAAQGWPVAVPLAPVDGSPVVTVDDARYSLFPRLPGRPAPYERLWAKRIKGRLLARLHDDLSRFEDDSQRDGFGRAWELDVFVEPAVGEPFNALLRRFGQDHPELASAVRTERYRSLRELSRLRYGELPTMPVHADFHHDNLLFEAGTLTALLDFDFARRDAPAFDIAQSIALECLEPPTFDAIDPRYAHAFLDGYASQRPLRPEEAQLIVPLVRAAQLLLVTLRLTEWASDTNPRAVASIARSAQRRFPALEARTSTLRALALKAAERGA
jgi:homoserine kinase type II